MSVVTMIGCGLGIIGLWFVLAGRREHNDSLLWSGMILCVMGVVLTWTSLLARLL